MSNCNTNYYVAVLCQVWCTLPSLCLLTHEASCILPFCCIVLAMLRLLNTDVSRLCVSGGEYVTDWLSCRRQNSF
jgi:hypothetical protein